MELIDHLLQTVLAFVAVIAYTRMLGKTQIGQLTYYDYVSGITIGSIAATICTEEPDKTLAGFASLTLFCLLAYIASVLTIKSRPLRKIIQGTPIIVIQNGKILERNMRGMRYDIDELMAQLREKDVFNIHEVEYAIMEIDGQISVLKKPDAQNVTRKDLGIAGLQQELAVELIMDGEIIEQNLKQANKSKDWLMNQLALRGITNISEVMYAGLDGQGGFYVDVKQDNVEKHVIED